VTKSLRIHRLAEDELADVASWYEARQTGLGIAFVDLVDKAIAAIQSGVLHTSPVPGVQAKGARRILLRRYPYSIVLFERKDEIVIVAFAHHSRRPGYWRLREPE